MTETQAKSGARDLGQPGRRGGRQERHDAATGRASRAAGRQSPPTRRARRSSPGRRACHRRRMSRRREREPGAARRAPSRPGAASTAAPHGAAADQRQAAPPGRGPGRISARVTVATPAPQPPIRPADPAVRRHPARSGRQAGAGPASGGGMPPPGAAAAVGAARVAEAVRAGAYHGQLGRRPRTAPGPAEPQADRPVVGDEVLVRGVRGAVHRGGGGDLGAVPGAGRDGCVRASVNKSLAELVNASGGTGRGQRPFQITARA